MAKSIKPVKDISTEEKIREAAQKIFTQKGYAATRTRDIAEEAGINLALLNYYFRSKEKLFEQIMLERVQQLFGVLYPIVNDTNTKLEKKIELIVINYIDMLMANPDLPIFVLSEVRNNPDHFKDKIGIEKILKNTHLIVQLKEKRPDIHPYHFIINVLGMTVFAFLSKPIFQSAGLISEHDFNKLAEERKILIPKWANAMLKTK